MLRHSEDTDNNSYVLSSMEQQLIDWFPEQKYKSQLPHQLKTAFLYSAKREINKLLSSTLLLV